MPTNAELTAQVAELTKRATDAEDRAGKVTADLENSATALAEARKTIAEQASEIETVNVELRTVTASLKAYKGSATKAQRAVTVLKKQLSPEARRIGAMKPVKSEEQAAEREALLEAAFASDTTELVYSDGQREIRELAPLTITGDAWRVTPQGRVLVYEPELEPGDCSRQEMVLRGFALLNEAGDQVGWCPHDPVTIGRNQRVKLAANSIRF